MGACHACSGSGAVGCLLLLEQGSNPLAAPAMGEPLLQGDCKMDLAEAEAQLAKCAKLNQLCFVDCFSFLTSHQTNTTLGPEQKLGIPLLFLPFLACPFPTCPAPCRTPQGPHSRCSSPAENASWLRELGSMVPRDEGLGLPGEQWLSQWPQPGTQETEWFSLWGCPCSRDFLKPSRGCFKSKYCKALPGRHLVSRKKKIPWKAILVSHESQVENFS